MPKQVGPNDNLIVMRGGSEVSVDSLQKKVDSGTEKVDTQDKLQSLSVQVWPVSGAKMDDLKAINPMAEAIAPIEGYTLTRSDNILKKGGVITFDPIKGVPGKPDNPYHALVSNITIDDLVSVFKSSGIPYKQWAK